MDIHLTKQELALLHYLMYNEETSIYNDTEEDADKLIKAFESLAHKINYIPSA